MIRLSDQIAAALLLPDDSTVVLDAVFVGGVSGQYASIRDMWVSSQSLLISSDAALQFGWTVKVTGEMTTVNGNRMLIADSVMMYVITNGGPAPPMPPCLLTEVDGISLVNVPTGSAQRNSATNILEDTPGDNGTIAYAKLYPGEYTRSGKVVTAVFYVPETTDVAAYYIQEPWPGGAGIRVVPEDYPSVHNGEIVDVTGTVVCDTGDAECYIDASLTEHFGFTSRPHPVGFAQRYAAGGEFGLQPALYAKTSDTNPRGGLSTVGTRVRVWGRTTWANTGGTECCIDDGSHLASLLGGSTRAGIRLIGSTDYPMSYQANDYVAGITGILGAEMVNGKPVPVIRITYSDLHPVVYVRTDGNDNNTGFDWSHAKATISGALAVASEGQEVWVAAGHYSEGYIYLVIGNGVGLYGGFTGSETTRGQRNWHANETIIDTSSTMYGPTEAGAGCLIDGFTFTALNGYGTAISCSYGDNISICHNILKKVTGVHIAPVDDAQRIRVSDNWIEVNGGVGIECYGVETRDSVIIANNTFTNIPAAYGWGDAICLYDCSPTIANNIMSGMEYSVHDVFLSSEALLLNNCVYQATVPYALGTACVNTGGISSNPLLVGAHIAPNSPCRDAGYNDIVTAGETDIDGQARKYGDTVDIGADESTGAPFRSITLSPDNQLAIPPATATITATVSDQITQATVSGYRVDFTVTNGTITAVGGNSVSPPASTAWGTTDSNGALTVTVVASAGKTAIITAHVVTDGIDENTAQSVVYGAVFKAGFLYYLSDPLLTNPSRGDVRNYFQRLDTAYGSITYADVNNLDQGIDGSFNTVFLSLPSAPLNTAQAAALLAFVTSGRNKRVVLVGEFSLGFSAYNGRLNTIAEGLGMKSNLFSQFGSIYDQSYGDPYNPVCPVDTSQKLMQGVTGLWDIASDCFADGWQSCTHPLAYLAQVPNQPWIIQQDTDTAGSRIAIHDSNLFDPSFSDVADLVPDKNFRFVRNLCTIFPD